MHHRRRGHWNQVILDSALTRGVSELDHIFRGLHHGEILLGMLQTLNVMTRLEGFSDLTSSQTRLELLGRLKSKSGLAVCPHDV